MALEGTLTQALWSCSPDSYLRDFLQSHFRGEGVKLIKKMGDTCSPPQAAGPRGRAALPKAHPQARPGAFGAQRPWRAPLHPMPIRANKMAVNLHMRALSGLGPGNIPWTQAAPSL
ncbi:hypothetical protein QTO34_007784 [Cnephaeus nilssonii]|uniref:Uncharacterized protein n=1 Tax=Cnephaeus nilssonii TaxID=3371016 RepID=A0AA40LHS3_CNENI|nr:hypothetical protein QTO34_007784 [Eptesicus nilssonii]